MWYRYLSAYVLGFVAKTKEEGEVYLEYGYIFALTVGD